MYMYLKFRIIYIEATVMMLVKGAAKILSHPFGYLGLLYHLIQYKIIPVCFKII